MSDFSRLVWELATSIPEGRVTTYGIIANAAGGGKMAARSITSILSKAPNAHAIPFHRIVYANGRAWFAPEHEKVRRSLYAREGIVVDQNGRIRDFDEIVFRFDE